MFWQNSCRKTKMSRKKRKTKRRGKLWVRLGLILLDLLVLGLLILAIQSFYAMSRKKQEAGNFSWDHYQSVVHALGGMDGKTYLNCKEGFEYYYEQGARLFEVDLTQTADGVWVCRHDWEDSMEQWEGDGKKVLMSGDFKNTAIYGEYTPLTLEDLLRLLKKYPDAYVIIDCGGYESRNSKNTYSDFKAFAEIARAAGADSVMGQMIPEIYNTKMYDALEKVNHFPSYMYSLWQEYSVKKLKKIAEYCKETGIPTVTINREYWTEEIQEIFDEQGIRVFVYTVNDQAEAEKYLKAGAAGICTDTLLEEKTSS